MMKILIDLTILKNPNCGLGQVALNYGKYFRDNYEADSDREIYLLVPNQYIGSFGNNVKYIAAKKIYRLFPWLIGFKFDVWHAIHQLSRYKPYARHYVLTIHDFNFVYEKSQNPAKVKSYLDKIQRKVDMADRVVCISQFAKSETERYVNLRGKQVEVIYNGIERIDLSDKKEIPGIVKPYFFSIGEIKEKKNFHVLLKMMQLMPEYQLYIAGNDNSKYADSIRSIIADRKLSNVKLLGVVTQEQKVWLYSNCSAFLFPSRFEGFGLPIVEAMLFHKPVVCSDATSLSEIGGGYVSYFPKNYEAEQSVEVICQALMHSETSLDSAYHYACSFSWQEHVKHYLMIYQETAI